MRSRFYSIFKFAKLVCMQVRHGLGSREFLNVSEKNKYNLCEALLEIARFSEKLQFFILHDRICGECLPMQKISNEWGLGNWGSIPFSSEISCPEPTLLFKHKTENVNFDSSFAFSFHIY